MTPWEPRVTFFAFYGRDHHPASWLGHCSMWGVTKDDTWLFLDPERKALRIQVAHIAEEVDHLLAYRIALAKTIIRYDVPRIEWTLPAMSLHTCASVCGAAVGIRAWSPAALQRKLLRNGGEIHHATTLGGDPGTGSGA